MSKNFLPSSPQDFIRAMDDVNRKMEEQQAQSTAGILNMPYIDLYTFPVDLNVLGLFTEEEAREMGAVPFYKDQKDLRIGTVKPEHPLLRQKLYELNKTEKVSLYLISKRSLEKTLKFYAKVLRPKAAHSEKVEIKEPQDYPAVLKNLVDKNKQEHISQSEMLEILFGAAIFYKASDIHLEPEDHFVKFRLRIDGVLQDMLHINKSLQKSLITRVKLLAKLKLNIENQPQDGRLTFKFLDEFIDVRVSVLPSAYGEEVVMRLLAQSGVALKLSALGFNQEQESLVEAALGRPNGMIITTGPTGSGKTTSLYTFLQKLNEPGVKIITLEDPVEYKLEGIVQTPIDHNVDFSFAKGLRAILRQDPDIVMVGEIRDQETAEVSMQAALTGHLVLSTLHTNDASGAIPRLINMGVKPFIIAPALSLIIAQRLVRKICPACKSPVPLSPLILQRIKNILGNLPEKYSSELPKELQFFHSVGCGQCHGLGYAGRIGIYEVLQVDDSIKDLIAKEASMAEFKKAALTQGMLTMVQDGLLKALEGVTDVEEVFRVAGE